MKPKHKGGQTVRPLDHCDHISDLRTVWLYKPIGDQSWRDMPERPSRYGRSDLKVEDWLTRHVTNFSYIAPLRRSKQT